MRQGDRGGGVPEWATGNQQRPGGIEKAGTVSEGGGQISKGLGHQVTGNLVLSWGR